MLLPDFIGFLYLKTRKMTKHSLSKKIRYTFINFIRDSRSVGILLLVCTIASLIITNNSFTTDVYRHFWEMEIPLFERLHLPHSILHFINDGLMAVFFFMAGMEIKRELIKGELSSPQQAILPTVAAISGALVPAIIFLLFNKGTAFAHGWGIPTATDIAFSLGIAALLGKRVPMSLRVFLTALAIIDDLCAIFIIALFYGANVHWLWLLGAVAFILFIILLNRIKQPKLEWLRFAFGIALWFCMFHSGIHPTVAGVIFALLVPVELLNHYENKIHVFVNFFIIPIFALGNTAIVLKISLADFMQSTLSWGIILGLLIGKPLGILGSCYFMIKRKWAVMPAASNWRQFIGITILAGIGFTMSIFVSSLAFNDTGAQDIAKIAIIVASFIAMVLGFVCLRMTSRKEGTI